MFMFNMNGLTGIHPRIPALRDVRHARQASQSPRPERQ